MNIFEGYRRITHVVVVAGLFVGVAAAADGGSLGQHSSGILYTAMWALVVYACSWVVGWVVRGFMGIPQGSDVKPETPKG